MGFQPGLQPAGTGGYLGAGMVDGSACRIGLSPALAIACTGIGMIVAHNLLDGLQLDSFRALDGSLQWQGWLLNVLHVPDSPISYPLIPWIVHGGRVCFRPILLMPPGRRQQLLLAWGTAIIAAFVLLRLYNGYGDPRPWASQATASFTLLSFLNTSKYPPSLLFLLMTLGPTLVLLAIFERRQARHDLLSRLLIVFGRVPLFFYLLHLYVIHGLVIVFAIAMNRHRTIPGIFRCFPVLVGVRPARRLPALDCSHPAALPALPLVRCCQCHKDSWWTPYI